MVKKADIILLADNLWHEAFLDKEFSIAKAIVAHIYSNL